MTMTRAAVALALTMVFAAVLYSAITSVGKTTPLAYADRATDACQSIAATYAAAGRSGYAVHNASYTLADARLGQMQITTAVSTTTSGHQVGVTVVSQGVQRPCYATW